MICPDNWHPNYEKNIKKLEGEGYHLPKVGELPRHLEMICGGETYMVNNKGQIKSVSQGSGQIADVSLMPPKRRPPGPCF